MIERLKYLMSLMRMFGLSGVAAAVKGKLTSTPALLEVRRPEIKHPFFLRVDSSDIGTFEQIFINLDYAFSVKHAPKNIIDAGGNIGFASIYFANKYPDAKIVVLEPEKSNFDLLKKNVALYSNITPVFGALWNQNGTINLVDPNLGKWGFMTQSQGSADTFGATLHAVPSMTVDTMMEKFGLERVDILKIDIEGAEREVFLDSSSWLKNVDTIIVELHERMKSGCNRAFYEGSPGFEHEWTQGENVYLAREAGCVSRP
jgi:FkbM family methyltransferase